MIYNGNTMRKTEWTYKVLREYKTPAGPRQMKVPCAGTILCKAHGGIRKACCTVESRGEQDQVD